MLRRASVALFRSYHVSTFSRVAIFPIHLDPPTTQHRELFKVLLGIGVDPAPPLRDGRATAVTDPPSPPFHWTEPRSPVPLPSTEGKAPSLEPSAGVPPHLWYLRGFVESLREDSQLVPFDDIILVPNTRHPVSLRESTHLAALAVLGTRGIPRLHVDFTSLEHRDESMPIVRSLAELYPNSTIVHWLHDAYEMKNWEGFGELKRRVPLLLLQTSTLPVSALKRPYSDEAEWPSARLTSRQYNPCLTYMEAEEGDYHQRARANIRRRASDPRRTHPILQEAKGREGLEGTSFGHDRTSDFSRGPELGSLVRGPWWRTKGGRGDDLLEVSRLYYNSVEISWLGTTTTRVPEDCARPLPDEHARRATGPEETAAAGDGAASLEKGAAAGRATTNPLATPSPTHEAAGEHRDGGVGRDTAPGGRPRETAPAPAPLPERASTPEAPEGRRRVAGQYTTHSLLEELEDVQAELDRMAVHHRYANTSTLPGANGLVADTAATEERNVPRRRRSASSARRRQGTSPPSVYSSLWTSRSGATVVQYGSRNVRQLIEELYPPEIGDEGTAFGLSSAEETVGGAKSETGGTSEDEVFFPGYLKQGGVPMVEVHSVLRCPGADVRQALWGKELDLGTLLTDCVQRYIESHGLYRDWRKSGLAGDPYSSGGSNPTLRSGHTFAVSAGGHAGGGVAAETSSFMDNGTSFARGSSKLTSKESFTMSFNGLIPRLELHYDKNNLLAREHYETLKVFQCVDGEAPDLIVPIGGDGYMMHCIRRNWRRFIPFYGVNAGHLGYLLNDSSTLSDLFSSPLKIHTTTMLYCQAEKETETGEKVVLSELAFNDAWVERSSGQTALIRILVNGEERIQRLRGDGVLVSTAAGSTAYSRALGASPVPVGAPLIQVVGSNVVSPAQWRPVHLDQEDQVEFEVIDTVKRPCRCFVDSIDVGNITRMLVRSSRVAAAMLAFSRSCDLQHKLYQMQFPKPL